MRAARILGPLPVGGILLLTAAGPAAAHDTPSPSATRTIGTAGTSFLTATNVAAGQRVKVTASTGDYLYWSFGATAGQTDRIAVTVTLPPAASRHGAANWAVDVFDGLRRRQACTAGPQVATAAAGAATVSLRCTLRKIRSWADTWSNDPLPGTYYLRLSAAGLPEQDLGLPVEADVLISAEDGSAEPGGGSMKAPLSPATNPGATAAPDASATPAPVSAAKPMQRAKGWFSWFSWLSTRWVWTIAGGVLAATAGIAGYRLTRHRRRWFS